MSNGTKMNLTQKAKKKLVGSFSKRKKLKISDGDGAFSEEDNFELPPPLPRTRPPIPDFSGTPQEPLGETVAYLPSSVSLPAFLDQSGVGNVDNDDNEEDMNKQSSEDKEEDNKTTASNARQPRKLTKAKSAFQMGEKVKDNKRGKGERSRGKAAERVESFRYTYSPVYSSLSDENLAASSTEKQDCKPSSRSKSASRGQATTATTTSASSSSPSSSSPPPHPVLSGSSSGYHSSSTSDLTSHVTGGAKHDKKLRRMMSDQQLLMKTSSFSSTVSSSSSSSTLTNASSGKPSSQWFKKSGKSGKDRRSTLRDSCGETESQDSCGEKSPKSPKSPSVNTSRGQQRAKFNMYSSADSGDSFEQDLDSSSTSDGIRALEEALMETEKSNEKANKKAKKKDSLSFFKRSSQKTHKANSKKDSGEGKGDGGGEKGSAKAVTRRRSRGETPKSGLDPKAMRRDQSSDAIRRTSSPCDKSRSRSCHARLGPRGDRDHVIDWSDDTEDNDLGDEDDEDVNTDANDGDNDLDDTDGEATLVAPDEDRILTQDIGIFEEVFEPTEDDISMVIVSQLDNSLGDSDTTLDFTFSSDEREDCEETRFMPRCVEESMMAKRRKKTRAGRKLEKKLSHRKTAPAEKDKSGVSRSSSSVKKGKETVEEKPSEQSDTTSSKSENSSETKDPLRLDIAAASSATAPCFDLPRIPRMDNSVLNKIKFFENFSEISGVTSPPLSTRSNSPMPSPSPSPSSSFNAGSLLSGKTLNARLAAYLNSHRDITLWTSSPRRPVSARGVVGERGLSPSLSPHRANKRSNSDSTAHNISSSRNIPTTTTNKNSNSGANKNTKGEKKTGAQTNFSNPFFNTSSDKSIDTITDSQNNNNINNNVNSNTRKVNKTPNDNDNIITAKTTPATTATTTNNNSGNKPTHHNLNAMAFKSWSFTNASPRLNFTKFRRSGSIPETAAVDYTDSLWSLGEETEDVDMDIDPGNKARLEGVCQVCHHPVCTEDNGDLPLLLCRQCESDIHRRPEYSGHLVLDISQRRAQTPRGPPPSPGIEEEEDGESDSEDSSSQHITEDQVDGLFVKHNPKIRNKSPSDLERKLKRKKALKKKNSKNGSLEAALAQIADPEGTGLMDADGYDSSSAQERRDSGLGDFTSGVLAPELDSPSGEPGNSATSGAGVVNQRVPVRRQSRIAINSSHFTLKFSGGDGQREDFEVVAAVHNRPTTLREAIESVLESRKLDINNVNVFIEKSRTPLPINSDTVFLAGNTLEIKEKDDKDTDVPNQGKQRNNTSNTKSGSTKGNKQGRNSRRDSVGVVPLLLEPPPTKQRRGSLQLPFREHFFNKGGGGGGAPDSSKGPDALKVYDDSFGSLRGRGRAPNLSVDDTFYPPMSPQGTWTEGTSKKNKSQKLSVVNLFTPGNKDRERQDQLSELLGRYSAHGLPPLPELLALGRPRLDDASLMMLELEPHWQSIVDNSVNMTKKQQEHQEAVWELIHTEVSYIKQIRVIMDVFQNCLINVQQEGFLNEIETERLFSNIDKIFECNCLFWQEYLLPVLTRSRETHTRLDPLLAREGFVDHFPILFQVYFKYFIEHKSCLEYAKSRLENSDLFKTFIQWAEAQKQCNRLKLADILVKPMQRLLKYSLLLQAVMKHTESAHEAAAIREMIESVEKLCWAANTSLQRREDYEKLEAVRKTIDLYDAIEAPNDECAKIIQEYNGNFNLLAPMPGFREGQPRSLLSHSSLRMKEAQAAKVDVDCLLFTDLILICKSNKKMDRFKIIRPPMRLDQLVVSELRDKGCFLLIYMNEYHVPISAFTFHSDVAAIRAWLERFRDAQKDYKLKKIQESAELERLRSGGAHEEVHYTPIISVPNDLDLTAGSGFPRSESMESADRFMPNLLLSPQADDAFGKLPAEIGRSGSTGDIYGQQFASASASNLTPAATGNGSSISSSSSSLPQTAINNVVNADSHSVIASRPPAVPDRTLPGSSNSSLMPSQPQGSFAPFHKPIHACRSVPNIQVGTDGAGPATSNNSLGQNAVQNPNWTQNNTSGPSAPSSSSPSVPHRTIINVNSSKDGSSGGGISQYGLQQQQQQQLQQQLVYSKQYQQPQSGYDVSSSSYSSSSNTDAVDQSSTSAGNIDISVSQVSLGSSAGACTDQASVFDEDELSRMKLASRRTSRAEKRYHTADSITDMKSSQEKDASIHKRLSWRTDVQVVDNKNLGSPNKALSTDSVRSYPSSSGVSSTGSLHLNLESDISEESEVSGFGGSSEISVMSPTRTRNMFTLGDTPDPEINVTDSIHHHHHHSSNSSNFDDTNNNNINNLNHRTGDPSSTGDYLEVEEDEECSLSDPSQGRSKSTPDLVTMLNNSLHVSEMEDGIASVAVSSEGFNRKLTHADILKMKKLKHQVLYDANVESSEV